jgi:integrase/recombinase XerD
MPSVCGYTTRDTSRSASSSPLLKVEQRIVQTLSDPSMQALLSLKPKRFDQWRLHALVCLLLDAGLRIEEALTLKRHSIDFDNLLVTVFGKGRKERRIPFSFELRKVLFRWDQVRVKQCPRCELAFPSRQSTSWDQRNSLRGLHLLQRKLGLATFGWHRLCHTFATNYLRQGGDIVRLSMVLGQAIRAVVSDALPTLRFFHFIVLFFVWKRRWDKR